MRPSARRAVADWFQAAFGVSERRAVEAGGFNRSSHRYRSSRDPQTPLRERLKELAGDPEIIDPDVRALPTEVPTEGVGVVEAPRGTLFHHYQTDERGVIELGGRARLAQEALHCGAVRPTASEQHLQGDVRRARLRAADRRGVRLALAVKRGQVSHFNIPALFRDR